MLHRSTLQLLRFHFSFFLLPVYLFAISQLPLINWPRAILTFLLLHLLVYPSSNGYNSYMDKDETPIGGLKNPLLPTRQLYYVTLLLDALAIAISYFMSPLFSMGILFYIMASRAYSYRGIRLKKYPILGFLTVFIFQGALIFYLVYTVSSLNKNIAVPLLPCLISSLLIAALYPLTQIYQHEADYKDGIITISYILGKRGSFVFSGILFLLATAFMYFYFLSLQQTNYFFLFLLFTIPVVLFFCFWMMKVWKDDSSANFRNSLWMNIIATFCTTAYFTTLILINQFE